MALNIRTNAYIRTSIPSGGVNTSPELEPSRYEDPLMYSFHVEVSIYMVPSIIGVVILGDDAPAEQVEYTMKFSYNFSLDRSPWRKFYLKFT